jgi:type IV pilus assembly protein PilC
MTTYRYAAIDEAGQSVTGSVTAETVDEVASELAARGLNVTRLDRRRRFTEIEIGARKIKPAELMHFSRQMAAFIRSGVPILEAIEVIQEEARDKTLRAALPEIAASLRRGQGFAEAVATHQPAFPALFVSVLQSAELTGQLDLVLDQLSQYIERDL